MSTIDRVVFNVRGLLEETNVEREFQLLKELNNYININVNLN